MKKCRRLSSGCSGSVRRCLSLGLDGAAALGIVCRFLPFNPRFPGPGLESGYKTAIAVAAAQGRPFGTGIVFTYGPYGAVWSGQYASGGFALTVIAAVMLGIAFAVGVFSVADGKRPLIWLTPALLALVAVYDPLFYLIPIFAISAATAPSRSDEVTKTATSRLAPTACLLVQVWTLGLLPLIKGSLLPATVLAMLIVWTALAAARRWKLLGTTLACLGCSVSLFWCLAGQSPTALPSYVGFQVAFIVGFSAAMSTAGPAQETLTYLGEAAFLLTLLLAGYRKRNGGRDIFMAAGTAAILFLAFKAGFVRHDFFHEPIAMFTLALLCWVMFLAAGSRKKVWLAAVTCAAWLSATHAWTFADALSLPAQAGRNLVAEAREIVSLLADDPPVVLRSRIAAVLERQAEPVPLTTGSTDIYPWEQSALLATNADWDPRPVFQSYTAYTPALARLNANHLLVENRPETILFRIQTIDHRLPSFDDGLSWPALLSLYRPSAYERTGPEDLAVLRSDRAGSVATLTPVSHAIAALDTEVKLPEGAYPVWATMKVRATTLGTLYGALFKPPMLHIVLTFDDGHAEVFRFIPGMAESGFLLSPAIRDTREFLELTAPNAVRYLSARRPVFFRITGERGSRWLWRTSFDSAFDRIALPSDRKNPALDNIGYEATEAEANKEAPSRLAITQDCHVDLINGHQAEHANVEVTAAFHFEGWAAQDIRHGRTFDQAVIRLSAGGVQSYDLSAHRTVRPDLGAAFGQPDAAGGGLVVDADLSMLPRGKYKLQALLTSGTQKLRCDFPTTVTLQK